MMNFCRDSCVDINNDNILDNEKKCVKNCCRKYLEQFQLHNSYKDEYSDRYGTNIFIMEKYQKDSFNKLLDLMKMNSI